jgi:hypothetical protein
MPDDTTPHGGEVFHKLPQRARIPDPPPQATDATSEARTDSAARPGAQAIERRPALPEHPVRMAADREDEDADPVVEGGPVTLDELGTGEVSVTRQPGG